MNYASWNVRGASTSKKKAAVRRIIRSSNVGFLALQETKIIQPTLRCVKSLWRRERIEWDFVPSSGRSGGLICVWSADFLRSKSVHKSSRWMAVSGRLIEEDLECCLVSVYAPNSTREQQEVWEEILLFKATKSTEIFMIFGDFNAVCDQNERKNSSISFNRGTKSFKCFVDRSALVNLPLQGQKFTWRNGVSASRIDRFLVAPEWFDVYPNLLQLALPKGKSDHHPLILSTSSFNWGPKPFRFLNCWLEAPGFLEKVNEWWVEFNVATYGPHKVVHKLKLLKEKIKEWNEVVFRSVNNRIIEVEEGIHHLDIKEEGVTLSAEELIKRRSWEAELATLRRNMDSIWKQKSRLCWGKSGDKNSKFFHASVALRRSKNHIGSLKVNGRVITSPSQIREHIHEHFSHQFTKQSGPRPSIRAELFSQLSPSSSLSLEVLPTREEIKSAVWSCQGDKAPGPDGFNFNFIRATWDIIGEDVSDFVLDFFNTSMLHNFSNSSFITLIPKSSGISNLSNYRPISLVGCLYKIISKLLAERLKKVMNEIIGQEQSAFIAGRQISETIMVANEVIGFLKTNGNGAALIKLDFKKAFDSLDWDYLDEVLQAMGFGSKWRNWILACISSASSSVLVNGSPSKLFKLQRGLRQGDPLSPFLFNIAAEGLRVLINKASDLNLIQGIAIPNVQQKINLLQFADDTLLFSLVDSTSMENLRSLILIFGMSSGLRINPAKTALIGINAPEEFLQESAMVWGCKRSNLPINYLGMPLGENMTMIKSWKSVIDSIDKRLALWKGSLLSLGGRLTLVRAVLSSLPSYFLSIFKVPKGVCKKIDQKMRNFLWSGNLEKNGTSLVRWNLITKPKSFGGWGLEDLSLKNKSMLIKWCWRFISNRDSLWASIISGIHSSDCFSNFDIPVTRFKRGVWAGIVATMAENSVLNGAFLSGINVEVGDGCQLYFWSDPWNGAPLKVLFQRLYTICAFPNAKINECGCWRENGWNWNLQWRRTLFVWEEELLADLMEMLAVTQLHRNKTDLISWKSAFQNQFCIQELRRMHYDSTIPLTPLIFELRKVWERGFPPKVECFLWIAMHRKIRTRDVLIRSGTIDTWDSLCPLCWRKDETCNHLLLHCSFSVKVWNFFVRLIGQNWSGFLNMETAMSTWEALVGGGSIKKIWRVLFGAIVWGIWGHRNKIVFDGGRVDKEELINTILLRGQEWMIWANYLKGSGNQHLLPLLESTIVC